MYEPNANGRLVPKLGTNDKREFDLNEDLVIFYGLPETYDGEGRG